ADQTVFGVIGRRATLAAMSGASGGFRQTGLIRSRGSSTPAAAFSRRASSETRRPRTERAPVANGFMTPTGRPRRAISAARPALTVADPERLAALLAVFLPVLRDLQLLVAPRQRLRPAAVRIFRAGQEAPQAARFDHHRGLAEIALLALGLLRRQRLRALALG